MTFIIECFPGRENYISNPIKPGQWVDKNSPEVRVVCKGIDSPFYKITYCNIGLEWNKTDNSKYARRLRLTLFPFDSAKHAESPTVKMIREVEKQKFPYSQHPTLFFAAFPSSLNGGQPSTDYWLMYSFVKLR